MEDIKPTRVNLRLKQTGPSCGHTYLSLRIRVQARRQRGEWSARGGGVDEGEGLALSEPMQKRKGERGK